MCKTVGKTHIYEERCAHALKYYAQSFESLSQHFPDAECRICIMGHFLSRNIYAFHDQIDEAIFFQIKTKTLHFKKIKITGNDFHSRVFAPGRPNAYRGVKVQSPDETCNGNIFPKNITFYYVVIY